MRRIAPGLEDGNLSEHAFVLVSACLDRLVGQHVVDRRVEALTVEVRVVV